LWVVLLRRVDLFPTSYKTNRKSLDLEDVGLEEHEEFEGVGACSHTKS